MIGCIFFVFSHMGGEGASMRCGVRFSSLA